MRFLPVFSFGAVYAAAAKAVRREKMRARHFTNFALSAKLYGIFAERKATGMDSYEALAAAYDELTEDVEYKKRAGFVEKLFLRAKRPVRSLLDLACGTGTMTELAAICCLDSINYLTRPRDVQRTFARLHDAIAPGGSLVFDVHAVSKMEKLDGEVLLDEREDVFCLWRTRYRKNVKMLDYEVDLFRLQLDGAWERDFEEHHQRAYTVEELTAWLEEAGFTAIRTHGELKLRRANERDGRIYFSCIRK